MARATEALTALAAQQEPVTAGQLASISNVAAALDRLEKSTDLSESDRTDVDRLVEGLSTMHDVLAAPAEAPPVEEGGADDTDEAEGDTASA